jgi:ubiquinone/menaquinone biosynthesis C-methylase UbiE
MTQNIYDKAEFFEGYAKLSRSIEGLDGAAEWPSLRTLLPELRGLRILDLGCGYGWFCRWVREQGAAQVLGIDVSERMLARARATTADAAIAYARADMEELHLQEASFDLAYSSLALHYIVGLPALLAKVHRALVPRGHLIFSVEHPIVTAPANPGWMTDAEGRKSWPVDNYFAEGPRTTDWIAKGVIKQHRTIATHLNLLLRLGFTIGHVEEWSPTDDQIAAQPSLAEERLRPPFLLVAARRQG